jgi:hypothetical protein
MKKEARKLVLSRETLTQLNGTNLGQVAGGDGWSDQSICPTVDPSGCRKCV